MRYSSPFAMAVAASVFFTLHSPAQFKTTFSGSKASFVQARPGQLAAQTAIVVVGKVIDVDMDLIELTPFRGASKDRTVKYRIATVRIEDPLIGGRGLTQFRVGFPVDAVPALPPLPGRGSIVLTAGEEGCFFLNPHHQGDFYVQAHGGPLIKNHKSYSEELEKIKKVAKIIDDPVTALRAKELDDRFNAAYVLLQRYHTNRSGRSANLEPIPPEENKLILQLLVELPWQAKDTKPRPASSPVAPSRSNLWYTIQRDLIGFKAPGPMDRTKIWEEATIAYLKSNMEKIKIKGFVK